MSRKSVSGAIKEEISIARNNLELLLKTIDENKDGSPVNSDDENELKIADSFTTNDGVETSPRRKTGSHGVKKKRRANQESSSKSLPSSSTIVVKLFDRSVDLAPYKESTPLYPICRSWMRNSASEQCIQQLPPSEPVTGGEAQFPAPYMKSNREDLSQLRIPKPLRKPNKDFDVYQKEEDAKKLLIEHLKHWRKVRDSWRAAGKDYEARFSTSHAIIKQMYESTSSKG